ncbi:cell wall protein DAN4 [Parambassis ranga]|uniref:Cell wall protein DAN4 n=1 Tax=Parambassis ranga TaxID=210632 RepID=A0A6P7I101_9TELE|nr:cell wall protein DAN4-like [Parambassis ranga]
METKLWVALCALLLLNLASGDHGSDGPQNEGQENPLPSQTGLNETHSPTSHTSLSTTNTTHPSNTSSVNTEITTSPSTNHSTSHVTVPPLPSSTTLSNQPPQNTISTSTSTAESPAPTTTVTTTTATITTLATPTITTTNTTLATTTSTQPSSTSSSSHQFPTSPSPTATSEFDAHPRTSSNLPPMVTITPSSSTSTQAKTHVDNPSQLNVEGDTKMVHESSTLDPLLAGLVSAFIIAAVIITLLLFLKLRRRDNRPEFRRLQDLPMDDIMEDTPLSMYSY